VTDKTTRTFFLAFVWFAVLSFAILAPSSFFESDTACAHMDSDIHTHLWIIDWMGNALFQNGQFPLSVEAINYPTGGNFIAADAINTILSAALAQLVGLPMAYSLVIWFNLIFAGIAFFLLIRFLTSSDWAAIITGTAYMLMPYTISYGVLSGVPEVNTAGYFPLFFYFLLRTIKMPGWKNPVAATLCLITLVLNVIHSVVMVSIFMVALAVYYLVFLRDTNRDLSFKNESENATNRFAKSTLLRVVFVGVIGLAVSLPYLLLVRDTIKGETSTIPSDALEERFDPSLELRLDNYQPDAAFPYYTPLSDYLIPGKNRPIAMDEITHFYHCAYLGLSLVFLAALGLWKTRSRFAIFLAALGAIAAILSAGPNLVLLRGVGFSDPLIPVFLAFYHWYPAFRIMMEPLRFLPGLPGFVFSFWAEQVLRC